MNKSIKNAFIFSSGAAVGFSVCGFIAIKKVVSSKYFKPVIRDMIADKFDQFLYGEDNRKESSISYPNVYHVANPVLSSRAEAEYILARMDEIIEQYEELRVSDVYDLIGISGDYLTNLYGWTGISDFYIKGCEIVMSDAKRLS